MATARIARVAANSAKRQAASVSSNPLLADWTVSEPFGLPPWSKIKPENFEPAFEEAMAAHLDELRGIANALDKPSFENTCAAFDRSGAQLEQVNYVFDHLTSSMNPEPLQKVQLIMAPISAAHETAVYTGVPRLFERIDAVLQGAASAGLQGEQLRLVQRQHLDFVRQGSRFDESKKKEYAAITAKLAELSTQFQQNVMADEAQFVFTMRRADLAGCPDSLVAAAKEAAVQEGKTGDDDYVITLSRSLVEPFLTFADNREMREKAWRACDQRDSNSRSPARPAC
jgi:peptidyl-dipeptidase Dcp